MNSMSVSLIVFACVLGGAIAGLVTRESLPPEHFTADSKETVKLGMGLVSTMSALVLGLLVSSAKTFYDTQAAELTQMSAQVVFLDRLLAHYGTEAQEARDTLRAAMVRNLARTWPEEKIVASEPRSSVVSQAPPEAVLDKIQALTPKNDKQRSLQQQALSTAIGLGQMRLLMYEQSGTTVSEPLLMIMVFWLTVIFFSFGLFSPRNATSITSVVAAALSVSGAIFLILEMYMPFRGLIQVSSAPLRSALVHLGQ